MKERFIIPGNFMESGYVFSGTVAIRNAVEAGILAVVGLMVCKMLPLPSGTEGITPTILIVAPFGMLGLYGVQGDPLSVFLSDFFKWRRRRKPYFYNSHGQAYTQEAADMLDDAPQIRDMLADALEKIKKNMASEEVRYVEGETFTFADDPEQVALRLAQEQIQAKRDAETAAELERQRQLEEQLAEQNNPFRNMDKAAQPVDAEKISQMLVLDDLKWEEGEDNG